MIRRHLSSIETSNRITFSSYPAAHSTSSDFGLAKAGSYLETRCGTLIYAAPEIAQYCRPNPAGSPRYTCAVDIWSLGVVVFQYGYDLPGHGRNSRLTWCEQIVEDLRDREPDSLLDILLGMLTINPKQRYSAEECLKRACELEGPQTPIPMPYERRQREIQQSNLTAIEPTAFRQDDHYFRDSEIQRYIRSQTPRRPGSPGFEGDIRQQGSSRSIQDPEIQGYIGSKIPRHSGATAFEDSLAFTRDAGNQVLIGSEAPLRSIAPTIIDKRRRTTATSSSSARRTKRTVAESSLGHLRGEEPSFAQGSQNDLNHAGYGEQNNSLGRDTFGPGANAQGSLNDGQGTENDGQGTENNKQGTKNNRQGTENDGQDTENAFGPIGLSQYAC